jgi:predicted small lipoprotein YifL
MSHAVRPRLRLVLPLAVVGLALAGCGVKGPPEVPQDAGPAWFSQPASQHGGGYGIADDSRVAVEPPPPAYWPTPEDEGDARRGQGVLPYGIQ